MDLVLRFSFAAQVIAALVIFVLGYVGLFATLLLAMVVARCLYEIAKWLSARASTKRPAAAGFPDLAGDQNERRVPVSATHFITETQRCEPLSTPLLIAAVARRKLSVE
jgi:hypothetical protein